MTTLKKKKRLPVTLTIRKDVKDKFQKYCDKKETTMSRQVEKNMIKNLDEK